MFLSESPVANRETFTLYLLASGLNITDFQVKAEKIILQDSAFQKPFWADAEIKSRKCNDDVKSLQRREHRWKVTEEKIEMMMV